MSAVDSATAILSTATAVPALDSPQAPPPDPSITAPDAPTDVAVDTDIATDDLGGGGVDSATPGGEPGGQLPTTAQIRASLKAFRDSNPEHAQAAKLLNDGYSRYEAYKAVIPTVEEARTIRAALDTVGGLDGLAELQSLTSSVETTDALLESGDPAVLDQIFEDAPEGIVKLAGPYLSKLAKANPEAYNRAVTPHFVRFLQASNFPSVLGALANAVKDKPEALAIVQDMTEWFANEKNLADRLNTDSISPERDRLNKDRESFAKEQRSELEKSIGTAVSSHINQELGSRLKPYAAALNALPVGQRQAVARACITELAAALTADEPYQRLRKSLMDARKPEKDRIVGLNKTQVTKLADAVVTKVVKDFGLKPGAVKPATKVADKGKSQDTRIVKIARAPKDSEIDWEYPDASKAYILHRARLKSGQFVEWPR